jgi:hypothetical protein
LSARSIVHSTDDNLAGFLPLLGPLVDPPSVDQWTGGFAPGFPRIPGVPEFCLSQDHLPDNDFPNAPYGEPDGTQDILDENQPPLPIPSPDVQMFPGRPWIGNGVNEGLLHLTQMQPGHDDAPEHHVDTNSFLQVPRVGHHRRGSTGNMPSHYQDHISFVQHQNPDFSLYQHDNYLEQPSQHSSPITRTISSSPALPTQTSAQSTAPTVVGSAEFVCKKCKSNFTTATGLR